MNNKGNYIASLSRVAAWLGGIAEELGVEVYTGFASAQFLHSPSPAEYAQGRQVRSAMTHDAPLSRQCTKGPRFQPGVAFRAWATLLTEGVHGSLSKQAVVVYDLRHGKEAQTYGIGIKEVWRVEDGKHVPVLAGKVLRTLGWPLSAHTYGGGWEYHMADGLVSVDLVVGLDYKNPYMEQPYRDFQVRVACFPCNATSSSSYSPSFPTVLSLPLKFFPSCSPHVSHVLSLLPSTPLPSPVFHCPHFLSPFLSKRPRHR
ncbi:hypothetical protein K438DRAFT_248793 [Mycena galopus ATCC 62051]|nr:hypothetical protein K438DRAFT_248793 [Mycena galopus ATCC 62051]